MRLGPEDDVLVDAAGWSCLISSWRDGEVLAETVPVTGGKLSANVTLQVPGSLTFDVPRFEGRDWYPGDDPNHPLARFGQEVTVDIVVSSAKRTGEDADYQIRVGVFIIQSWALDDRAGTVQVNAVGRLQGVAEARLTSPLAPRPNGTLASEFERLLPDGFSVDIHPDLVDRRCPQSMEWAEDRLGALYEIADAWPARLRTDEWGQLVLLPPLPETAAPIVSLADGEGGTVVQVNRTDTRDQAYNVVVARSSATDEPDKAPIQAIATQLSGPMRADGPYGQVVKFWSSPLVSTVRQAQNAANTMLKSSLRPSTALPVSIVPDPRLDLDDPVEVLRDGERHWGYITGYELPLTANDGDMRIDVGAGV